MAPDFDQLLHLRTAHFRSPQASRSCGPTAADWLALLWTGLELGALPRVSSRKDPHELHARFQWALLAPFPASLGYKAVIVNASLRLPAVLKVVTLASLERAASSLIVAFHTQIVVRGDASGGGFFFNLLKLERFHLHKTQTHRLHTQAHQLSAGETRLIWPHSTRPQSCSRAQDATIRRPQTKPAILIGVLQLLTWKHSSLVETVNLLTSALVSLASATMRAPVSFNVNTGAR